MKLHPGETYGEVIELIIEDLIRLNEKTMAEIKQTRTDV
jgi:hypothetical protein